MRTRLPGLALFAVMAILFLIANRDAIGGWETFAMVVNPDNTVSLRATVNNKYVVAENGGAAALIANRDAIGPWEKFERIQL